MSEHGRPLLCRAASAARATRVRMAAGLTTCCVRAPQCRARARSPLRPKPSPRRSRTTTTSASEPLPRALFGAPCARTPVPAGAGARRLGNRASLFRAAARRGVGGQVREPGARTQRTTTKRRTTRRTRRRQSPWLSITRRLTSCLWRSRCRLRCVFDARHTPCVSPLRRTRASTRRTGTGAGARRSHRHQPSGRTATSHGRAHHASGPSAPRRATASSRSHSPTCRGWKLSWWRVPLRGSRRLCSRTCTPTTAATPSRTRRRATSWSRRVGMRRRAPSRSSQWRPLPWLARGSIRAHF